MKTNSLLLVTLLLVDGRVPAADNPFATHIRPTEPLSPAEQQKSFRLPAGFEIQLFAAEPDIQKPLNMAFDHRGRLWITDSVEYPYAAPKDRPGRDTIKVLEDTDGDGRADRITTFADGLNIPIGIYPYFGGVVAYSIPNIWKFQDTDGDGKSDKQTKLYGPFGFERDTHGMNNAFRRHFDGWLYACHGFNNHSTVKGKDGHTVTMQSGNTYRMRLDGSRIEQFTWGQVNPFGMTMDEYGNLFTSDCHSKPIYQLLRGGYYPSFGKPHDGLGFDPQMMNHTHGSTAIAGVAYYSGDNFPKQYRGNFFVGNVMTSRVNRDLLIYKGATPIAKEQPDFVTTTDPWFRPVDIQIGPDGAMYVADFYNRIIGHYEVPLDHPGRDRHRGRIWRVVYKGDAEGTRPAKMPPSLADASVEEVVAALESSSLTWRTIAMNLLVDKFGKDAVAPVHALLKTTTSEHARSHALWILHRLDAPEEPFLDLAQTDTTTRVHQLRILAECTDLSISGPLYRYVRAGLVSEDPIIQQAAVETLSRHPNRLNALVLGAFLKEHARSADKLLRHAARIALRNQLLDADEFEALRKLEPARAFDDQFADVATAVNTHVAAEFLLDYLDRQQIPDRGVVASFVTHAARYGQPENSHRLINVIEERFEGDLELQLTLFDSVVRGFEQRGAALNHHVRDWGAHLAAQLLDSGGESAGWQHRSIPGKTRQDNPWVLQQRVSADGDLDSWFLTTLPSGEQATGVIHSPKFKIPQSLSFFAAGHIGHPGKPVVAQNFIRLREAETGQILAETTPPRNDTAQQIQWQLKQHAGKSGYIEIVDGDERRAYAWLAVGRFSPQVVELPKTGPRKTAERLSAAASITRELKLSELKSKLEEMIVADAFDPAVKRSMAEALLAIEPNSQLAALTPLISDVAISNAVRVKICRLIAERDADAIEHALSDMMRTVPSRLQSQIAQALTVDPDGARALIGLVSKGHASPRLLNEEATRQRLAALDIPELNSEVAELTANLPSPNDQARTLIAKRVTQYGSARPSLARGAESFNKNCAACHQLEGKGKVVGPQLDGIGGRGSERLFEDILDPNRNVDVAFRSTTIVTSEGKVLSGLVRRAEGQSLVLADNQGKEFTVAKSEIDQQQKTNASLMPDNFGTTIPAAELLDLVAFLLSKTVPRDSSSPPDR